MMLVEATDLVTGSDIARNFGVTRQASNLWLNDPSFPAPVAVVNGGYTKVWTLSSVVMWHAARPEHTRTWEHRTREIS